MQDFAAALAWVLRQFEAGNWTVAEEEQGYPLLALRDPPNAHVLDAVQALFWRHRRRRISRAYPGER